MFFQLIVQLFSCKVFFRMVNIMGGAKIAKVSSTSQCFVKIVPSEKSCFYSDHLESILDIVYTFVFFIFEVNEIYDKSDRRKAFATRKNL